MNFRNYKIKWKLRAIKRLNKFNMFYLFVVLNMVANMNFDIFKISNYTKIIDSGLLSFTVLMAAFTNAMQYIYIYTKKEKVCNILLM